MKEENINYFSGDKQYRDKESGNTVIKVFSGDCYISDNPDDMMVTILGSCISACIRDPALKIGGMNHFLLPDTTGADSASARYGAYAMEQLINELLKKGARKDRLEIKVFGGGNVIESSAMVGDRNVKFIRDYLKAEDLKIKSEDLGGTSPRRIHYYPCSGRVMMRKVERKDELDNVRKEETTYKKKINIQSSHHDEGDVELF